MRSRESTMTWSSWRTRWSACPSSLVERGTTRSFHIILMGTKQWSYHPNNSAPINDNDRLCSSSLLLSPQKRSWWTVWRRLSRTPRTSQGAHFLHPGRPWSRWSLFNFLLLTSSLPPCLDCIQPWPVGQDVSNHFHEAAYGQDWEGDLPRVQGRRPQLARSHLAGGLCSATRCVCFCIWSIMFSS